MPQTTTPNVTQLSGPELLAELDRLRAEVQTKDNEIKAKDQALKAKSTTGPSISFKISPKGCVQLCGNGRFPMTYYPSQWVRALGAADRVRQFIKDHAHELSWKDDADKARILASIDGTS